MIALDKELIEQKFKGVYARMDANSKITDVNNKTINDTLLRIEKQTIKTNGRVRILEGWRWKVIGISIGAIFVISYLIRLL